MRRAIALLALAAAGCGGPEFLPNLFPDSGELADVVAVDQVEPDAGAEATMLDAADAGEAAETAAPDVLSADVDAGLPDVDAGDGFDGCLTTIGAWCSGGGAFVPCGTTGNWRCEAGLCSAGVCSLGVACWGAGGTAGDVVGCAP